MALNWVNVNEYDFNCLLLMEGFQLDYLCRDGASIHPDLGIALRKHPAVKWYIAHLLPEHAARLERLSAQAPDVSPEALRQSECAVLSWMEDFVTYTTPEFMADKCPFIYGWHKERLFEVVDLDSKRVLDVGSGNGRLTFAAAERASEVYAVEPVATLRQFMRQKCLAENIRNVRVTDGLLTSLPYPDCTFDVVLSGHVAGDDYDAELTELERVCKPGGVILDIPGDQHHSVPFKPELLAHGYEMLPYIGTFGAEVRRYRKVKQG